MAGLDDFTKTTFTHDGKTRDVYKGGTGPAVVVMAEIPGITPKVLEFAQRVIDIGCTAVLPVLFGTPGKEPSVAYGITSMVPACISKEFTAFATGKASPVTVWLRALAKQEHERCGGPGVGAVGMCFTGGYALAMMVDDTVLAPVLSQPSLPLPFGADRKRAVGVSDADMARVKERVDSGVCLLGLRFTHDSFVPEERFQTLREVLGDGFVGVEIDSSPGNPWGHPKNAHSVLTEHLIDEPGQPTQDALNQVLDLFRSRLLT